MDILDRFQDKVLLITGGTGSFGNAVLGRFTLSRIKEVRIFSRDEKKQDDMRQKYNNPKIKYYLGDVRDYNSIHQACVGVDYLFHAAALKQVPSCEFYPLEAVKTNVLGAENVLNAAISAGVSRVICLSTDKAVYPINAMGMSKALMEKVMMAKARTLNPSSTVVCATRYGNVLGSRGSVVPLFISQIKNNQPLTITNPEMTRFMMTLEDAVELVLYAFIHGNNGDLFIQKAPASTIADIAFAVRELCGKPDHPLNIIGTRHGEKLFESLLSRQEMLCGEDLGNFFRVPVDNRDLNYSNYISQGIEHREGEIQDYNSHNTKRLNLAATKAIMLRSKEVQQALV